jgi:gamma-glutamyltranspeptidase/glutathione hydrolase
VTPNRAVRLTLFFSLALLGCEPQAPEHPAYGNEQIARSRHGMVVSGSPLATSVGVQVLESGGNAVDAAVATAFALSVVEPSMSGLGGRTQILLRTPDGEFAGIDGTTQAPAGSPTEPAEEGNLYGYATIGVPGTVAALAMAHAEYGKQPWAALIAPAITLAEEGFTIPPQTARRIASVADPLRELEASARYFLKPDGTTYASGERLVQRDLARTLRAIAEGGTEVFYLGWIADSIAADMRRHGGFVRVQDLAAYEARPSRVVRGSYRGYDLVGTYLPASGATTIEALQILERFDLTDRVGDSEWVALTAQALLLSFEDRTQDLGTDEERAAILVSKDWAAERAGEVNDPREAPALSVGTGGAGRRVVSMRESAHTTHLSVADRDGGLVALTQSLGPTLGSKVAAPGLGFLYAATMGYLGAVAPGARPFSSQSPLIVLNDGKPAYVLGGAGARRIISAIVEVVSRLVDEDVSLAEAMALPRFHPTNATIFIEGRRAATWSAANMAELASFGFAPEARGSATYFAVLHGIEFEVATGDYIGVADPRYHGSATGARR